MAVTDPQDGHAESKNSGVDVGAAGFENAGWAAGDDKTETVFELIGRRVAGLDVGVDAEFTDSTGDQMCVLTARVENSDLWDSGLGQMLTETGPLLLKSGSRLGQQAGCLGHSLNGLEDLGILFHPGALGILVAERRDIHFSA
jgi:hypothetical protein